MPDAFFVTKKARKRQRSKGSNPKAASSSKKQLNGKGRPDANGKSKSSRGTRDEELDSGSGEDDFADINDLELRASDEDEYVSGDEDELETPAQKRLRLATAYLDSVKEDLAGGGGIDAAELDRELITSRLKQDVLENSGKLHRFLADSLDVSEAPRYLRMRGHRQTVTAAVVSKDGKYLFTSGKEGSIIVTNLSNKKQAHVFRKIRSEKNTAENKGKGKQKATLDSHGHTDEILALAVSDDGKYLASGGKDRKLVVWDLDKMQWLRNFGGHKDTISCLAFRKNTSQLYTGSLDRSIKLFDLSPSVMGYVDTLFGHQDHVVSLTALGGETAVSAGARDRTLRFWKVVEETQLVFRGGGKSKLRDVLEGGLEGLDEDESQAPQKKEKESRYEEGSVDCVAMIDESTFISGGDSGSLSIWITSKKKPVFSYPVAHGFNEVHSETEGIIKTPRWITALACLPYGDVVASGSWSSDIRLWKLLSDPTQKGRNAFTLTLLTSLSAPGIVNSLQLLTIPTQTTNTFTWANAAVSTDKSKPQSTKGKDADSPSTIQPPGPSTTAPKSRTKSDPKAQPSLLVVAALGREPRLGRWLALKGEDGAANAAYVFLVPSHQKKNTLEHTES